MAWEYSSKLGSWVGLSAEVKPMTANKDEIAYEYDTRRVFIYEAGAWTIYKENLSIVSSIQQKWRDAFATSPLDPMLWDTVQIGAGASLDLTSVPGELAINTGSTGATETIIRTKSMFTVPFRGLVASFLSQRIAGQEFYLEFVSVDPVTGIPDGKNSAGWMFDGTTATQAKYRVQNSGLAVLASVASTLITTAAYALQEIELFVDEVYFHSRAMDSTAGRVNSYVRQQQLPDPNAFYKFQMRAKNISGVTTTAFKLQFVNINDYEELAAEITAGRGNTIAGQGIYATVGGSVTATGVAGAAAHDAVVSGNPVRIGARALTANYTGVATGDTADLAATIVGALIHKPFSIPESDWQFACASPVITTADLALKAVGAAGIRNYVTSFQYQNTNAVATEVVIKDGATAIWRGYALANMVAPITVSLLTPLRGTAATAMNFACITTAASVYVNAQGYQAP